MPALSSFRMIGSGGANRAMEAELKRVATRLGLARELPKPKRVGTQTLVYDFVPEVAFGAMHYLRTPSRVLWDQFEAEAERLEPLYDEVLAWVVKKKPKWLTSGVGISIYAAEVREFPASGNQIRGTIKNALIDGSKKLGLDVVLDAERPDVLLAVRGTEGPLVLGIDLAGRSMHRRGYRLEPGAAPLRETLAAQVLMLSRWDPRKEVLFDPMAGSGTLAIEGALLAFGRRVFTEREPPQGAGLVPFRDMPEPALDLFPDAKPQIVTNEVSPDAVDALVRNIERARVADFIIAKEGDLADIKGPALRKSLRRDRPPGWAGEDLPGGLLIANPPHGERLNPEDWVEILKELGRLYRSLGAGWRAAVLSTHPELEQIFGEQARMKKPMSLGPLKAQLFVFGGDRPADD